MSADNPDPKLRLRDRVAAHLPRLKRRQVAYRHVWVGRLIFWGGAVGIGLVAVPMCGPAIAAIGAISGGITYGTGYGEARHLLAGEGYLPGMTNVLCMAGFLAAVTLTPITAFVIVMEMVSGYGLVIDLMIVTLLASGVSRTVCPPLYRTLALRYLAGPERPAGQEPEPPAPIQTEIDFPKDKS